MSFINTFTEWAKNGTKAAPTSTLESTGFTGGMKPPASVFNYMWDKIGKAITELQTAVTGKANATHTHVQSDVTGLASALSGKANTNHTHAQSDVTGLTDALAAKVSTSQGTDKKGKFLSVGTDGNVTTTDNPANSCVLKWQGTAGSGKMLTVGTDGYVALVDKSSVKTTATIGTTWAGSSAPYTQNISITGVTADNVVEISLPTNATAAQVEAYNSLVLQDGGQSANTITLRAFGSKNTIAIPINVIIRRDI